MTENPQGLELFVSRQQRKRHLAGTWGALSGLRAGMVAVDFGCGPAILTREYGNIVGEHGLVYGVEQNISVAQAIGELTTNVRVMFQNYDSELILEQTPDVFFMTDVLHHLAEPLPALRRVRAACGENTVVFVAEYDPAGAGKFGAKLHRRLPKARLLELLAAAGFRHDGVMDTEDEHYAVLARC